MEIIDKLKEWNPWWESNRVPDELIGNTRSDYNTLIDSISIKEVIIITGIRRSGKSTLMYQIINTKDIGSF